MIVKGWGNYYDDTFSNTTGMTKTGEFNQTKALNIYDLAGNIYEWTNKSFFEHTEHALYSSRRLLQ